MHNAIRKYGWDSFEVEVLCIVDEKEVLQEELKQIMIHNTITPNGYNLVLDGGKVREFSKETLELKSNASQRRDVPKQSNAYLGVSRRYGKFVMHITKSKKSYCRTFEDEIEAAEAYDRMAIYLHGPGARINFIDNLQSYLQEDLKSFFDKLTASRKASKYEFIWFHVRHNKWVAATKKNGKIKSLGMHLTEEQARAAQLKYIETGDYERSTPDKWNYPTAEKKSVHRARSVYTIRGLNKKTYITVSLAHLSAHLGISNGTLQNSLKLKRPSRGGWIIVSVNPFLKKDRTDWIKDGKYFTWKEVDAV